MGASAAVVLSGFGYKINDTTNKLEGLDGSPFAFTTQKNYEAIGGLLTKLISERLQRDCGLIKQTVPLDAKEGEPTNEVLMSPDALTCTDKPLLMLVPGISIEIGQWARKIVINESVKKGSMMEYVQRAQSLGFNVILLNSNLNAINGSPIRGSESPEQHVSYIWHQLIEPSAAPCMIAVAHSYGGVCMQRLLQESDASSFAKLKGIALTDSVHGRGGGLMFLMSRAARGMTDAPPPESTDLFGKIAINWVQSNEPLGTELGSDSNGLKRVSAGTTQHDQTTVVAINEVFQYLDECVKK
ncbi:hypothetical protein HDU98_007386 [Podochytrium sp. JEL0797]|nr:hypothetical protein HDU98_007385 [Podochytrium sp. JEL0797]KAJ3069546.1 hypothetical protein HDU98_007386 [Podochytrium sp. JEL0797]